jgi:hypothetical protein
MKILITFFVLLFSTLLTAQDTAKVLIVESLGKSYALRPGQEIRVKAGSALCKGILREVTDSLIRVESEKGICTFGIASITAITWYDAKTKGNFSRTMIVAGSVAVLAGTTLVLVAVQNPSDDVILQAAGAIAAVIIATPLVIGGLLMTGVGLLNADGEDTHRRSIGGDTRLRVGGGKPAAGPSTPAPARTKTTVE